MACALTQDYSYSCDIGVGGTKEIWLIEFPNIVSVTESSGTLTAITKATGTIFRKYQLVLDTAFFEEDIQGNRQNGTLYYPQKGTIVINKQNVSMRNEILLLAQNKLCIVVHDNNDTYRFFGRDYGMHLLTGSIKTGTAWGDRNGYDLNFTGMEPNLAPFISSSIISTLQTPG